MILCVLQIALQQRFAVVIVMHNVISMSTECLFDAVLVTHFLSYGSLVTSLQPLFCSQNALDHSGAWQHT